MTRCPTCHLRKPDSLFTTIKGDFGKCLNCRTNEIRTRGRKSGRNILTTQADEIEASKEDKALLKLARKEMRGFKRRGSPKIDRPYAYIGGSSEKGMIARGAFKREGG